MIVRDEALSTSSLTIVEKYETFVNYLYPILQNCPRKHGVARDLMLAALFAPVEDFHMAGKSHQVSRLYAADAKMATLRFWLRFAVYSIRIITPRQETVALAMLAEVGRMLGGWIKTENSRGRQGK